MGKVSYRVYRVSGNSGLRFQPGGNLQRILRFQPRLERSSSDFARRRPVVILKESLKMAAVVVSPPR